MKLIDVDPDFATGDGQARYAEVLRTADLSVGTYALPRGAADLQGPHTEDEIYIVLEGTAVLEGRDARLRMTPGAVAFVAAGEEHRFVDIASDFAVIVVFGPAEYSRSSLTD